MITPELKAYVEGEIKKGVSRETIMSSLVANGWTAADVAEMFSVLSAPAKIPQSPMQHLVVPQAYVKRTASKGRKIFFAALVFVLLVVAGGGAYAYYSGFFVSLPQLTSEALDNARAATGGNYDTTIRIDLSENKEAFDGLEMFVGSMDSDQIRLTMKGSYDVSDPESLQSATTVSADIGAFLLVLKLDWLIALFTPS